MAFRFSLQSLLRLRRSYERRERLRLEVLTRQLVQVRQQLEAVHQDKLTARRRWAQQLRKGMFGAEMQFEAARAAACARRQHSLASRIAELEQQRRQQQAAFQLARQQCPLLENLRHRQLQLYCQRQARREQQQLDELFRRATTPQQPVVAQPPGKSCRQN